MIKKYEKIISLFIMLSLFILVRTDYIKADEKAINQSKTGLVQVYSGVQDNTGKFKKIKSGNGFLIQKTDGHYYIVTSDDVLKNNKTQTIVVKVVVRGDTTVDAQILTESKQENYGILVAEEGLENKTVLSFRDTDLDSGEAYILGFLNQTENRMEYEADNVFVLKGKIGQDNKKELITETQENIEVGGPVLDQEGYVIGVNNGTTISENQLRVHFTPISEIKVMLKSFNIGFSSKSTDNIDKEFQKTLGNCQKKIGDSKYTDKSKQELETITEQIESMKTSGELTSVQKIEYTKQLKKAEKKLEKKMRTTKKIVFALIAVIGILFVYFLKLVMEMPRHLKEKDEEDQDQLKTNEKKEVKIELKHANGFLKRISTEEKIKIDKDIFYIGKTENMDFKLQGNSAISRKHAMIIQDKRNYYIEDLGSANGTFVNGEELEEGKRKLLKSEDKIMLADEILIFEVENNEI